MKKEKNIGCTVKKSISESIKLVGRYSWKYLIVNAVFVLFQGLVPAALIMIMRHIINLLQKDKSGFKILLIYIFIYIILNILNSCLTSIYSLYNNCFALEFTKHLNLKMLNKAAQLKLKNYEDSDTYNMINRAQNQNGSSILMYISQILETLKQIVTIISTIIILLGFRWWIFGIVLIVPIIRCYFTIKLNQHWYKIRIDRTEEERKVWYINFLMMTGNAFKEIKMLGIKQYLIEKYNTIQNKIINQDKNMNKKNTFLTVFTDISEWVITGTLFIYTVFQGYLGRILIGDVTAYTECIYNIEAGVQNIFTGIGGIIEKSLYIELLFDFLNLPSNEEIGGVNISKIEKIELKNLSFKYGNGKYALKNINLTINANSRIALVGRNGSGKSTLSKIILGLYEDYEGDIYINDINLKEIDLIEYRKKFGCVFQDYVKYETTLRENIAFGDLEKYNDDVVIEKVVQEVKLDCNSFKEKGLETIIGYWFGEQQASVGEWQRIAIARALIKDADIYVFDEPDASLDILKQKELISTYSQILQNKIGIYISHKVNYVHLVANQIYVLENGRIVEIGTHKELLHKKGIYNEMYYQCEKFDQ